MSDAIRALAFVVVLTGAAGSARVHAQASDDASTVAAARALAIEGVKLAQAGNCEAAIDKLERAEALHHAPIVLGQLGECYIARGNLVAGTELLRSMLREPLPARPSLTLRKSYERATAALEDAKPSIARLTITVRAPGAAYITAHVDGQPVPTALLGQERPSDPGEHIVEAAAPGYRATRASVTLSKGEAQSVLLDLEADPAAVANAAAMAKPESGDEPISALEVPDETRSASAPVSDHAQPAEPNHTVAYASWAAGALALALGTGYGVAAASAKGSLESRCQGNTCDEGARGDLDHAQNLGTTSTVFFSLAAIGAAVGTVLYLIADLPTEATRQRAAVRIDGAGVTLGF